MPDKFVKVTYYSVFSSADYRPALSSEAVLNNSGKYTRRTASCQGTCTFRFFPCRSTCAGRARRRQKNRAGELALPHSILTTPLSTSGRGARPRHRRLEVYHATPRFTRSRVVDECVVVARLLHVPAMTLPAVEVTLGERLVACDSSAIAALSSPAARTT